MPQLDASNLIWIDLEMTGLDPQTDSILEIATVVTDAQLHVLAEGPVLAIHHEHSRLEQMDDWNRSHHGDSGLWQRVLDSRCDHASAEARTLAFLQTWVPSGKSPICANTICQDRRFLAQQMPRLERFFHYRHIDVSTLKELARRWVPEIAQGFHKESAHTALSDIHDSIDELVYYRRFMGRLSGQEEGTRD